MICAVEHQLLGDTVQRRHVIHRGQLRGLAEAQGLDEFPDTDWFYFCNDPNR